MPISSRYKFIVGIALSGLMAISQAHALNTRWRLRVTDLKHHVMVDSTIRFAKETATESCMNGTWKRIVVEAKTAHDGKFFPLAEPLAYRLDHGLLSLGRTGICDGYLFLIGKPDSQTILGTYNAVGLGSGGHLGYFSLTRVQ